MLLRNLSLPHHFALIDGIVLLNAGVFSPILDRPDCRLALFNGARDRLGIFHIECRRMNLAATGAQFRSDFLQRLRVSVIQINGCAVFQNAVCNFRATPRQAVL